LKFLCPTFPDSTQSPPATFSSEEAQLCLLTAEGLDPLWSTFAASTYKAPSVAASAAGQSLEGSHSNLRGDSKSPSKEEKAARQDQV